MDPLGKVNGFVEVKDQDLKIQSRCFGLNIFYM